MVYYPLLLSSPLFSFPSSEAKKARKDHRSYDEIVAAYNAQVPSVPSQPPVQALNPDRPEFVPPPLQPAESYSHPVYYNAPTMHRPTFQLPARPPTHISNFGTYYPSKYSY